MPQPNYAREWQTKLAGSPMGDKMGRHLDPFVEMFDRKGKGAPQQPPPMDTSVPMAPQGATPAMDPTARQRLLQAMMARSRMGRATGGATGGGAAY